MIIVPNIKMNKICVFGIPSDAKERAVSVGHNNKNIPIGLLILVKLINADNLVI
tara:strand:+ start:785 stop:946 length:162 start_codon:yes stop_codon:yes gene_type:complete